MQCVCACGAYATHLVCPPKVYTCTHTHMQCARSTQCVCVCTCAARRASIRSWTRMATLEEKEPIKAAHLVRGRGRGRGVLGVGVGVGVRVRVRVRVRVKRIR